MPQNYTYDDAGVNRKQRVESKKTNSAYCKKHTNKAFSAQSLKLPYGNIFPAGQDRYLDLVVEGVGTKSPNCTVNQKI